MEFLLFLDAIAIARNSRLSGIQMDVRKKTAS